VTRIVAGEARGRRLQVPSGAGTRPTSDRVREALFSAVQSARGGWSGARVLDLYAGSGALGLEALSRGADTAEMVELARRALTALRHNVKVVGLPGARVVADRVERHVLASPAEPFDVIMLDPPYSLADAAVGEVLASLVRRRWFASDALVVVERSSRGDRLTWPAGLEGLRQRRYGETTLWYGQPAMESQPAQVPVEPADDLEPAEEGAT
jgi:16S rRNA (guanine966-N2)-methyltransferase